MLSYCHLKFILYHWNFILNMDLLLCFINTNITQINSQLDPIFQSKEMRALIV